MRRAMQGAACGVAMLILFAAATATTARADFAPGSVLGLLSPARTAGRAYAGVAAFWDPADAANPALAAFGQEVELESDGMLVQPGVAGSPEFMQGRLSAARAGLGVSCTGWPLQVLGNTELSGPGAVVQPASDTMFVDARPPHRREYAYGVTVGASLPALSRRLQRKTPLDEPPAFDLAVGFTYRSLEERTGALGQRRLGGTWDAGAFARWTLADTRRRSREHQSVRLDAAAGLALANANRLVVTWPPDSGATVRVPRTARVGGALSLALRPCPCAVDAHRTLAWLRGADQAIARVSLTAETQRDVDDGRARSWHVGVEASFGRVLTLRAGRVHDESAMLEHNPTGLGIGIPLGRFGTLRWDQAHAAWARGARQRRIESLRLELTPSAFARRGGR